MTGALLCDLGGARVAVPVAHVRGVVTLETLTPVPSAPAAVRGVTQIAGQVLPVADLGALRGGAPREARPGDRLVLVEAGALRCLLDAGRLIGVGAGDGAAPVDVEALLGALAEGP